MRKVSELPLATPGAEDEIYLVQAGASWRARVGALPLPAAADARLAAIEAAAHVHANAAALDATTASFRAEDRAKLDSVAFGAAPPPTAADLVAALDGALGDGWRAAPPVASVNGQTGAVLLDPAAVGAATAAQGARADRAALASELAPVASSGSFRDLSDAPVATSALINDGEGADSRFVVGRIGGVRRIERLDQAAYDALAAPDESVLYVITL